MLGLEQLRDDLRQGFIGGPTEYFGVFVIKTGRSVPRSRSSVCNWRRTHSLNC